MGKATLAILAVLSIVAGCASAPPGESGALRRVDGVTLPAYETVRLDNGMTLLLMEKHDVPLIAFRAMVRGGAVTDPKDKAGTSALLAELLRKGAGGRDARSFAEAVASVGGRLQTGAGMESLIVTGLFMSRDAGLMVELAADVLMDPALDPAEFDKLKARQAQQIQAMKDTDLRGLTPLYGDAFLFGAHPYATPVEGSESSLERIEHADLRRYFSDHVGADRTVLAVVGAFDTAEMRQRLETRFAGWRRAGAELPPTAAPQPVSSSRVLLVDKPDATQTYFYLASIGVARTYEDRAALDLVNTVFGGRFTSMLNTRLRVESGLTYGAVCRLERNTAPGALAVFSFTRTDATAEAIDMALDVLETLHEEGLSASQLASAKAYVLGQFPPDLETSLDLAGALAELEFYGLGREHIDGYARALADVTLQDTRRVIEAVYPRRDNLAVTLLGNASAIREQIAKYGPVTEMEITEPRFRP